MNRQNGLIMRELGGRGEPEVEQLGQFHLRKEERRLSDELRDRVRKLGDLREEILRNSGTGFNLSMRSGKKYESDQKQVAISARRIDLEGTVEESEVQDDSDSEVKK